MRKGLFVVDFHTHLQDCHTQDSLCCDARNSVFFKHAAPLIEQLAHVGEPVYTELSRSFALTYRDAISRYIYGIFHNVLLVETLRLFKKYGVEQLVQSMDKTGIDHAVIHSLEPITSTQNILEQISPYSDRFSVFASVHRSQPDPVGYVSHFVDTGVVRGIKLHPLVGQFACGELYHKTKDLMAYAGERQLPVLIHTGHIPLRGMVGCSDVDALEPLFRDFPSTRFVLGHIGLESWRRVLHFAARYSNVSVETSWQPARVIRRAVDLLGPERVIFGSDFPLFQQSFALNQVRSALTTKELVSVTSVNAIRLLRLPVSTRRSVG